MRIAVVDSGVNPRHPHISSLAGGVSIGVEVSVLDTLGHGTAVMAAIQEKAPDAEYYAVKLFHSELRASTDDLLKAIEWTIEQRMDVVNLSLGTRNSRRLADFELLVKRALASGVAIVSARDSDGQLCYPGSLPGVIAVALDWDCPRETYRFHDGIYYASGYPRPVPGMPVTRNLNGISFAVANISGLIASGALKPNIASAP